MNKLKTLFLGLGCMTALSLVSCLKSETSEEGLSQAQISQCFAAVKGNYSGKMIYSAKNPQNIYDNQDTIDIEWTVNNDTMLIVKSFPANIVAENIRNNDVKASLMEDNPKQDVKCMMAFTGNDPYVQFVLGPQRVDYPCFYKGFTHTLNVFFWADYHSYGEKDASNGEMVVRLTLAAAYIDGDENTNLLSSYTSEAAAIPVIITNTLKD